MKTFVERVTDMLVEDGVIKSDQLREVKSANNKVDGNNFLKLLVDSRVVSDQDMLVSMGRCTRTPPINLTKIRVPPDVLNLIPGEMATNYMAIPVAKLGRRLYVAMADPLNILAIDDIRRVTQMEVFTLIASERAVAEILQQSHPQTTANIDKMLSAALPTGGGDIAQRTLIDVGDDGADVADDAVVVKSVNMILAQAVRDHAADVHIEPQEKSLRVRFGVHGQMEEIAIIPKNLQNAVISRCKIMAVLDIAEHRVPQDGRIALSVEGRDVDLRVSVLPTMFGERIVMRLLDKAGLPPNLDTYTHDKQALQWMRDAFHRPQGMCLMTGPTGSGKTTTLYRALQELNSSKVNIITCEDPVEYQLPGINQVQINSEIGMTFAAALRAILRQAPNIVLVGEIRDNETADIAAKAALTGHLVLSTLHTNDAPSTIARLVDMGIEPFLVGSTVAMICAQRLARKLCPHCKEKNNPPEQVLRSLGFTQEQIKEHTFYKPTGCPRCRNTGIMGRAAVVEVLRVDEQIRELIFKETPMDVIRKTAEKNGMKSLRTFALHLAMAGDISLEEVLRVTADI